MANLSGRPPYKKTGKAKAKPKRMRQVSEKRAGQKHPLRENASGKRCAFRFKGCRGDPAYTVLAHFRKFGWAGAGQKPNDMLAAFGCDLCHDKQERRHPEATDTELLRAMGETLITQERDGKIIITRGSAQCK